jgi:hypothetical protein
VRFYYCYYYYYFAGEGGRISRVVGHCQEEEVHVAVRVESRSNGAVREKRLFESCRVVGHSHKEEVHLAVRSKRVVIAVLAVIDGDSSSVVALENVLVDVLDAVVDDGLLVSRVGGEAAR